jgi:nucleotide-binding universal stress UspA family protein
MFEISRVLAPVVFSDNCRGALCYAIGIASRFGAELTVLHVLEPPAWLDFDTNAAREEVEKCRRDWVYRGLTDLTSGLHPPVKATTACVDGDPAREIIRFAEGSGTNLIVIATHGYGPFRRFLLGSVTAKVLHDATCAVWTGAHFEQALAKITHACDIHAVLSAVSFDSQTASVLDWSAGIASAFDARLTCLHVVPAVHDAGRQPTLCGEATHRLNNWCGSLGVDADCHVAVGDVTGEIAGAVRALGADLLVIGRGHLKAGGRLRSTSYSILRESPCPVVSV